MIRIEELKAGDRVRIVSEWKPGCGQNLRGHMDAYLGTIMTVAEIQSRAVRMFEDDGLWAWLPASIVEVIDDDIQPATQEELFALLIG